MHKKLPVVDVPDGHDDRLHIVEAGINLLLADRRTLQVNLAFYP